MAIKKLYRSETDKVIAGVAGGLGEYLEIDATLIRLLFVILTVFGGGGLLIYLAMWLILPKKGSPEISTEEVVKVNAEEIRSKTKSMAGDVQGVVKKEEPRYWLGAIIVLLGAMLLLQNLGLINMDVLWPLFLIGVGLIIIFRR